MSTAALDPVLAERPDQKVACVLLLDTSGSMQGERIAELNAGLHTFKEELLKDSVASSRVDLCVITFDSEVKTIRDFGPVDGFEPPTLTAQNQTFLGSGILEALDKIEERKETYKANGIAYYRPWLFIITDGVPEGEDAQTTDEAKARLKRMQDRKGVIVYAVGVGGVDLKVLSDITGTPPLALKGTQFRELFSWLSKSLESVSKSTPGAQIRLPDPHWAQMQTA